MPQVIETSGIVMSEGSVTTPQGFRATGLCCGIRAERKDLALLWSDHTATAAGVFTLNLVRAAPVLICEQNVANGHARAVVINSGNANACTGAQGLADAREMVTTTARELDLEFDEVLVASTGVIGQALPMDKVRSGLPRLKDGLSREGGPDFSQAILTTDAFEKTVAVEVTTAKGTYLIGGTAKGAGMIHPNMATTLAFLSTDAKVEPTLLRTALKAATDQSFNCITVDGDTSTNDTMLVLANGASGVEVSSAEEIEQFTAALTLAAQDLAKKVVKDGEGASRLVEIIVSGLTTDKDARQVAQTVAGSLLFKTMLAGGEPNWGRVLAAAGRAGVPMSEENAVLSFADVCVYRKGAGLPENQQRAAEILRASEITMHLELGGGPGRARIWTCDINEAYVKLNGEYMT